MPSIFEITDEKEKSAERNAIVATSDLKLLEDTAEEFSPGEDRQSPPFVQKRKVISYYQDIIDNRIVYAGMTFVAGLSTLEREVMPSWLKKSGEQEFKERQKRFIEKMRSFFDGYYPKGLDEFPTLAPVPGQSTIESNINIIVEKAPEHAFRIIGNAAYNGSFEYLRHMLKDNQDSHHSLFLEYNRILKKLKL